MSQPIRSGQLLTSPPLKTSGNIVVSGDGLLLEDESAYLNAGDFQGMFEILFSRLVTFRFLRCGDLNVR